MHRGVNQQQIMEDKEDYAKFIWILTDCKSISGFKLYAYCLMGNHFHLVIKVRNEPIGEIVKRICARYARWFNIKYQRVGHLFQDRFKSEPIENEGSFLRVLRYVHLNPVKAGMVHHPGEYPYSSYNSYMNANRNTFVDTSPALRLVNRQQFAEFHGYANKDTYLDVDERPLRLTDERAKEIIRKMSRCASAADFQQLDAQVRNDYIRKLRAEGLSIRQINRLTGISRGVIQRCER